MRPKSTSTFSRLNAPGKSAIRTALAILGGLAAASLAVACLSRPGLPPPNARLGSINPSDPPPIVVEPAKPPIDRACATKYPILLVHGISWRDDYPIPYWGSVPETLVARGARVYLANHDAWGSIEANAGKLVKRIEEIRAETGAQKVDVIAHSKGGLETRYLISTLKRADLVASLTTINTPHRGSSTASFFLDEAPLLNDYTAYIMDFSSIFVLGDITPDAEAAVRQLTPKYMAGFNDRNPDDPRVYYQSWTSVISESYGALPYVVFNKILVKKEGPNDGFVSVESAKWGRFRGVIGADTGMLISHSDVHGLVLFPQANKFDAPAFYVGLVKELKDSGY
jgi:triacylglycerol lipase